MSSNVVELETIDTDISPSRIKKVYNPLSVDFVHKFNGEEKVIKSEKFGTFPENVAVLLAKHLAQRIVFTVAEEDRMKLLQGVVEKKEIVAINQQPYPRFNGRVGDVSKLLVFNFDNEDAEVDPEEVIATASEEEKKQEDKGTIVLPVKNQKNTKTKPTQTKAKQTKAQASRVKDEVINDKNKVDKTKQSKIKQTKELSAADAIKASQEA